MSGWELAAVVIAIAYLLLALREQRSCWIAAFISTAIYLVIFYRANLYMESILQLYYLVMAVYGWHQWHSSSKKDSLRISRWPVKNHVLAIISIAALSLASGNYLESNTDAAMPYLDSFTTWAALITTYMVTQKIVENWLYWVVIDAVSIHIYFERSLMLTAVLFALYVVISVYGYVSWRSSMSRQQ